jgi:predicted RNase H-like nuclease (RuvC/YqgF family)
LTRIKHVAAGKLADATKTRFLKEIEESKRLAENANKVKEADEKIREHKKLQDLIAEKDQEIEHLKRSLAEANQENERLKAQVSIGVPKEKIAALNKGLKKAIGECANTSVTALNTLVNLLVEFNDIPVE